VVEVVVALVLVVTVVQAAWRIFSAQRGAAAEVGMRSELLDAARTARVVLGAELGAGVPGRDWVVSSPGVVEVRAFRGWAAVCPTRGRVTELVVAYRGLRAPDPSKDSLLVLDRSGSWMPAGLVAQRADEDGCPSASGAVPAPAASLERWDLDRPVEGAVLARLFERGSYHLTDGALRYRRGSGGRQPLTPTVLDPETSGVFPLRGGSSARLTIGGTVGWGRTLFGNIEPRP
jgi:hypothetical protein